MVDVVEILRHWHGGRRIGELCSSLAVDPKTVRKYTVKAIEAGLAPGGPPLSTEAWSELVEGWFPELVDRSVRQKTWPEIEAHRERIKGWLEVVTVATIHQRLRDDHGLGASESSLRRLIWANFDEDTARAAVRVLRDAPPAGEEAQVDYGLLGRWFDPAAERMRRVWGFVISVRHRLLLGLSAVALIATGCGGTDDKGSSQTSGGRTITISNFDFAPDSLNAKVGDTITVENKDTAEHTVTAIDNSFDTGRFASSKRTFTVTKTGRFEYACLVHPFMSHKFIQVS